VKYFASDQEDRYSFEASVGSLFIKHDPFRMALDRRRHRQRRTSGGKGMEYRLPKCGNVFLNHNHCLPRCNAELAALASSGKKRWHVRRPNRNRLYLNARGGEFGITPRRLHVSLPAPSPGVPKAKFRAFPPLVLRCSSGRPRGNPGSLHLEPSICASVRCDAWHTKPSIAVS
jgi:hypothetical protein